MNLKGQWDKLTESQQWNLIYCFHRKLWRGYWGLKKKYLIANEKGENLKDMENTLGDDIHPKNVYENLLALLQTN